MSNIHHYTVLDLNDLDGEVWRDVLGYEGLYVVSNLGRVKSLARKSSTYFYGVTPTQYAVKERICKQHIVNGYLYVHLSRNGVRKNIRVHRIVAEAFMPNTSGLTCINHLDEDKLNNTVSNIVWCSVIENSNYGTRNSRISKTQRNSKTKSKPVVQMTLDGDVVKEWPSMCEAGRHGYDRKRISLICRGLEGATSDGYLWKFKLIE